MSVILLTSAVVLSLMCAAYIIYEYSTYKNTLKTHVSTLAAVVAANSSGALAFDSPSDANDILAGISAEKHIVRACLYNIDSKLFAKYPSNAPDSLFPKWPQGRSYTFSSELLSGFEPVLQDSKSLGTLYIVSDLTEMYHQLQNYAVIGILIIVCSLVVAYILSQFLQKNISTPIIDLEKTAKSISDNHDYSVRAPRSKSMDEVGALTETFNLMLTQIESQNAEIKGFNYKLEQKVEERTSDLKQQRDFVEAIINASVDLIAVFDTDTRFVTMNAKCEEYYGLKLDDCIGKKMSEVWPDFEEMQGYHDLLKAIDGTFIHNPYYKSKLNSSVFENFLIPLRNVNGKVYSVLLLAHDITEITEANEKLEVINTELLKSNRDLEQFAYVASHDLQEPLRKIQTFTQLMGMNFGNQEKMTEYHAKISQAALRMQQLIQDVLNFSRISNSEDAFEEVDLESVLNHLKNDFELILNEKKAIIQHTKLPVIKGVPLQLTQLFSNLISNSLKYNDKNPVIDITWKKMTPDEVNNYPKLSKTTPYLIICFRDNGIGFDPQYRERIFAIFQRLHSRSTYSGTGIGLALCRKIVENHGGIIFAEGELGKGSTFTIILPYF
jgi:PAS domain S-box-containing protein